MKHVYENKHIPSDAFPHLFIVNDPPPELVANIGRDCYLKIVDGMANPYDVPVAPAWREKLPRFGREVHDSTEPTDQPRLFRVEGLQRDYKGAVCYRIHGSDGDLVGRCAAHDEVIFAQPLPPATP